MVDFRWSMAQSRPRYGEIYTLDCGWERRLALVPGLTLWVHVSPTLSKMKKRTNQVGLVDTSAGGWVESYER